MHADSTVYTTTLYRYITITCNDYDNVRGIIPIWGRGKVACWRTKAAISLERVKIEEKLLWTAYRNSPTLFQTVPSSTLYGLPFPEIGGL